MADDAHCNAHSLADATIIQTVPDESVLLVRFMII